MALFDSALFKLPHYSNFDLSHDWKGSYSIGELVPVYYRDVAPGERFVGHVEQLTRFAPMLAPVMQQFDVSVDSFFVPYRLLNIGSEDYFNLSKNKEYKDTLRSITFGVFKKIILSNTTSTLADYFGFPSYRNFRDKVREALLSAGFIESSFEDASNISGSSSVSEEVHESPEEPLEHHLRPSLLHVLPKHRHKIAEDFHIVLFNKQFDFVDFITFGGFIKYSYYRLFNDKLSPYTDALSKLDDLSISVYLKHLGKSIDDLLQDYLDYAISKLLSKEDFKASAYSMLKSFKGSDDDENPMISILPYYVYWRIISDWYVNPNVVDPEEFYHKKLIAYDKLADGNPVNVPELLLAKPYLRQYSADYFTSAFADMQSGNAVSIPTNGTIVDLRQANAIQKMKERILYAGKRYVDNIRAFFGVQPSDKRLFRSEVLGRDTYHVNISAITQTNQSDLNSMLDTPLGTYAGEGFSAGRKSSMDYTAEEHGMIMYIVSVRPKASYFQGFNPMLFKNNVTDHLIPDLANIGEQDIPYAQLYFDYAANPLKISQTFGYTRRYAEYMFAPSEVHGDFRHNLDYWHGARIFSDIPFLSEQFSSIDSQYDNLNRIFAVPSSHTNIYQYLHFDLSVISPLPRYINYSL